jgi:hypothetical protein
MNYQEMKPIKAQGPPPPKIPRTEIEASATDIDNATDEMSRLCIISANRARNDSSLPVLDKEENVGTLRCSPPHLGRQLKALESMKRPPNFFMGLYALENLSERSVASLLQFHEDNKIKISSISVDDNEADRYFYGR